MGREGFLEFRLCIRRHAPVVEVAAVGVFERGVCVGVAANQRGVRRVHVDSRVACLLNLAGQPGVVGVPVREEDVVDVREFDALVGQPRAELVPCRVHPVAGVDEHRLALTGDEVGVAVTLEHRVRERNPFHTPRCWPRCLTLARCCGREENLFAARSSIQLTRNHRRPVRNTTCLRVSRALASASPRQSSRSSVGGVPEPRPFRWARGRRWWRG